ncbi:MAG: L-serine ammonia-lyase, partial [Chloroflexi bacterium]|nr:L-serine ammonia-lyase [Chloroflexota bacterium]
MSTSIFDLFKIGIGPSSSHTVGPMKTARMFALQLQQQGLFNKLARVTCTLHGSLGATGVGHGSDTAVLLGLCGHQPDLINPDTISAQLQTIRASKQLHLLGECTIPFVERKDLKLVRRALPYHPNGLTFTALAADNHVLLQKTYYSVGGGFVVDEADIDNDSDEKETAVPHPFTTAAELLQYCDDEHCRISDIMLANEQAWRSKTEIRSGLWHIWDV